MTRYFSENAPKNAILVGDLNIAPLAEDVWSTKQLLKIISHTPVETDGLKKLIADGGWVDAVRQFYGPDEKIYSWWSYRSKDWSVNNRGRRLDHVWMSRDLVGALKAADISIDYRNAEKPSDHVPVIVEL
jgi:exodeoxyribonuclease-3